jgi:hypothetical protein
MGRSYGRTTPPFKFYLNLSKAIATNVYLNLYPRKSLLALLEQDSNHQFEMLEILKRIEMSQLIDEGRTYGGGLHKIEPKELAKVRLAALPDWLDHAFQPSLFDI